VFFFNVTINFDFELICCSFGDIYDLK